MNSDSYVGSATTRSLPRYAKRRIRTSANRRKASPGIRFIQKGEDSPTFVLNKHRIFGDSARTRSVDDKRPGLIEPRGSTVYLLADFPVLAELSVLISRTRDSYIYANTEHLELNKRWQIMIEPTINVDSGLICDRIF